MGRAASAGITRGLEPRLFRPKAVRHRAATVGTRWDPHENVFSFCLLVHLAGAVLAPGDPGFDPLSAGLAAGTSVSTRRSRHHGYICFNQVDSAVAFASARISIQIVAQAQPSDGAPRRVNPGLSREGG